MKPIKESLYIKTFYSNDRFLKKNHRDPNIDDLDPFLSKQIKTSELELFLKESTIKLK